MRLFWIDTKWGCGGLVTEDDGTVKHTAPIFRKFVGQAIQKLRKIYKVKEIL